MISRIWYGYTTLENADAYESLLKEEIFKDIENREISGYKGINLLRRELYDEVEFITIMWFESIEDVRSFAGDDYRTAVVPPKAMKILKRFDDQSKHYNVKVKTY